MAAQVRSNAKTTHVNMMVDSIIVNLPPDMLRGVMRAMLASQPSVTPLLEGLARTALEKLANTPIDELFSKTGDEIIPNDELELLQKRIRAMIGAGMVYETLDLFACIIEQVPVLSSPQPVFTDRLLSALASLDSDIVQALTAIQKSLFSESGSRELSRDEKEVLEKLFETLETCQGHWSQEFPMNRSFTAIALLLGRKVPLDSSLQHDLWQNNFSVTPSSSNIETFQIQDTELPRLFMGLWQLSSASWGSASQTQMTRHFVHYVSHGFTAFDMADHYGDAEVIFGRLRNSHPIPTHIFAATKWCVFHQIRIMPEVVRASVTERCTRLATNKIDLLQFHWQFYEDEQYIAALQFLQNDERVRFLGLVNFNTKHMQKVLDSGVNAVTNQVQFSLIDARPRFTMGEVCTKHNVKLLTYGTLCGGFLADKWLGKPEPQPFGADMTPSQRKYFEMILIWGDWTLFQELLATLKTIAGKYGVSISNVASRWVLDFPYVGAVIVGARMGVSEHLEENLKTYGWRLDSEDQASIEAVLKQSRSKEMFEAMGDCGSELRL